MTSQGDHAVRVLQQAREDLNLARMLWRVGQQAQAKDIAQRVATSHDMPESGLLMVVFALAEGDLDQAREWLLWVEERPDLGPAEVVALADARIRIYLATGEGAWALDYAADQIAQGIGPSAPVLAVLIRDVSGTFSANLALVIEYARHHYPQDLALNHNIALTALRLSKFDYVLAATDILCPHAPDDPGFAVLRGYALIGLSRIEDAVTFLEEVTTRFPDHARLILCYSCALNSACRFATARAVLEKLVQANPDMAEAWVQLGLAMAAMSEYQEARTTIEHALALDPQVPDGHANLASVLMRLNCFSEAEVILEQIAAKPEAASAILIRNLGQIYQNSARQAPALAAYRQAIAISPTDLSNWGGAVMAANYSDEIDEGAVFDLHRQYGRLIEQLNPVSAPPIMPAWVPLIRIGFVSGDFNNHACARFSLALMEYLKQFNIQIFIISASIHEDHVTDAFRDLCTEWIDARDIGNETLVAAIRARGIQALVDLSGHTAHNRLSLFALRPCPMQVSWLGYPNTTGMTAIDYRVTDIWADPPGMTEAWHTEKLLRMKRCFLAYQPVQSAVLPAAARGEGDFAAERSGQPIVFGSLNNLAKITPACCRLWTDILKAVPDSRLLIRRDPMGDPLTKRHFTALFTDAGIAPERLDFRPYDSTGKHYDTYQEIDIVLDCFPYNGTTTTCEAISAGVPVIALAGQAHRSRVGVSLLHAIGRPEWVAETPADYVAICAALASDPQALRAKRAQQAKDVLTTSLFDTYDFAVQFWETITEAWREICISAAGS